MYRPSVSRTVIKFSNVLQTSCLFCDIVYLKRKNNIVYCL